MHQIDISADDLISALLRLAETESVCILDSCGVGHLGSHLLIAGIEPESVIEMTPADPQTTLDLINLRTSGDAAVIITLSYGFGEKLLGIGQPSDSAEPDIFAASFNCLIVHDYDRGVTFLTGQETRFAAVENKLRSVEPFIPSENVHSSVTSNFSKGEYIAAIESIKERIRTGDTYQTNLTQHLTAVLSENCSPADIFLRLRRDHPAPFAAFIGRRDSTVVSASPERFFKVEGQKITTSPIKGTRERGANAEGDEQLRSELLNSSKDIAENTMIVDLLRNDLGRVCEYGSVRVEKLCELEEHPTLFHLVSTVSGHLRADTKLSDILRAVFPCGSITGAPKISTMRIIDELETLDRGLSMGAIGYCIPDNFPGMASMIDLSVAIRTMVIRDRTATFNVGGGIVIDSDPEMEYNETLTKAKALLAAIGGKLS